MMSDSVLYMCVREGFPPPVVRNKLGLWLDSSIWKSLASGSERDIQMVSLMVSLAGGSEGDILMVSLLIANSHCCNTDRNTLDASKKEQ